MEGMLRKDILLKVGLGHLKDTPLGNNIMPPPLSNHSESNSSTVDNRLKAEGMDLHHKAGMADKIKDIRGHSTVDRGMVHLRVIEEVHNMEDSHQAEDMDLLKGMEEGNNNTLASHHKAEDMDKHLRAMVIITKVDIHTHSFKGDLNHLTKTKGIIAQKRVRQKRTTRLRIRFI